MPSNKLSELIDAAEAGDIDYSLFEGADDKQLEEMNQKHAFINTVDGRPMVLCYVYSPVFEKDTIEFRTPDAIKLQYSNKSVELMGGDKIKYVELGTWWVKNSRRREYETVIFDPAQDKEYKQCFNLWEGFNVAAKKGNWGKTRKHIRNIICNKDKLKFMYFIRWLAWCVQNPQERAEVAVVLKGREGAGKGFIFTQMVQIFGRHGLHISNREHLTGKFTGHLKLISFLFADEAYYPGDKDVEGALKQLITEPVVTREAKFANPVLDRNRLHIGMATNNDWVIPAGSDARRYFINEVDNKYSKGQSNNADRKRYFNPLWGEMNNGGREAMLFDLLRINLKGWHPRDDIPETEELKKQQAMSLSKYHKIVYEFLEYGDFPGEYTPRRTYEVKSKQLMDHMEDTHHRGTKIAFRLIGSVLTELGARTTSDPRIGRHWIFPSLNDMRKAWDKKYPKGEWKTSNEDVWTVAKLEY